MSILGGIGSIIDAGVSLFSANKANKLQKQAAKKGVQWRVADAKKAGVHPLAALGMSPVSMSPVAVGGGSFGNAGQSFDNAIAKGSTSAQASKRIAMQMAELQLEGAGLDNDIKRAELASRVRRAYGGAQGGPLVPIPGPNEARGADIGGQHLPYGNNVFETSAVPTAEELERQYGDVVQNVYGTGRGIHDLYQNRRMVMKEREGVLDRVEDILKELLGVNPAY